MICFIGEEVARGGVTQEGTLGVGEKGSGFVTCSGSVAEGRSGSDPIFENKAGGQEHRRARAKAPNRSTLTARGGGDGGDLSRPRTALSGITLGARPGQDHASALLWGLRWIPRMDRANAVNKRTREVRPNASPALLPHTHNFFVLGQMNRTEPSHSQPHSTTRKGSAVAWFQCRRVAVHTVDTVEWNLCGPTISFFSLAKRVFSHAQANRTQGDAQREGVGRRRTRRPSRGNHC
jgi:hypothetical protein